MIYYPGYIQGCNLIVLIGGGGGGVNIDILIFLPN